MRLVPPETAFGPFRGYQHPELKTTALEFDATNLSGTGDDEFVTAIFFKLEIVTL